MNRKYEQTCLSAFIAITFVLAAGCASRWAVSDWKEESYREQPKKVLILALLYEPDRRRLEKTLAARLERAGINAILSYPLLPEGEMREKKAVSALVKQLGADALLTVKVVDRKSVHEYVPGIPARPRVPYLEWYDYYGGFYPAFRPARPPEPPAGFIPRSEAGYYPSYTVRTVYDIAEAGLYTTSGRLVWSAVTQSLIQGGSQGEVDYYTSRLLKSLRKHGLIP